jgi:hypothetical protein
MILTSILVIISYLVGRYHGVTAEPSDVIITGSKYYNGTVHSWTNRYSNYKSKV